MKYLSVCSGIEAATVAWHPFGWEAVAYSEIEKFPSEVLAHHYPNTPNVGDMTKFKEWNLGTNVDLLVGGTPCQSFSVAGLRKGLDDPRGNLMLTYLAIARQYRPRWLVWENVPGVLSSNGGLDFASLLRGMAELGYGFAYRILDAQYFGVAQRRRRVFVVGHLGNWRSAASVLFESHSLSGYPAPGRKAWKETSSPTEASLDVNCIGTLTAGLRKMGAPEIDAYTCFPAKISYGIPGNWIGRKPENGGNATEPMHDLSPCLTKADQHGVAQQTIIHGTQDPCVSDIAFAQGRNNGGENVLIKYMAVRRLTPVECERLQGFPDNYTDIQPKGKPTPDGPRYKALGNSMAVPVMAWIGKRIKQYEELT